MTTPALDHCPNQLTRYTQAATYAHILRHATRSSTTTTSSGGVIGLASPGELRGIPAIGKSVTGAIPGTVPHQRLL